MKLCDINRLDEALALHRTHQLEEGMISDLVAAGVSRMQIWLKGHGKAAEELGLQNYIYAAKKLDVSLLDDNPEANEWWAALFNAFQQKHGYKTSKGDRENLIAKIKTKLEPEVNRDLEDIKKRLEELAKQQSDRGKSTSEIAKLFKAIFGDEEEKPPPRRRRGRSRRDLVGEVEEGKIVNSLYIEGLADSISNALDVFDPKKRTMKGAALIRSSNNAKIAAAAITMLVPELRRLHAEKTGRTDKSRRSREAKKARELQAKREEESLRLKFEIAQYINNILDENGPLNGFQLRVLRKSIRNKFNVDIDLKHSPGRYPDDFEDFKNKYGIKKENPIEAEVVPERDSYTELMKDIGG